MIYENNDLWIRIFIVKTSITISSMRMNILQQNKFFIVQLFLNFVTAEQINNNDKNIDARCDNCRFFDQ
jgi:hypothetical protein